LDAFNVPGSFCGQADIERDLWEGMKEDGRDWNNKVETGPTSTRLSVIFIHHKNGSKKEKKNREYELNITLN